MVKELVQRAVKAAQENLGAQVIWNPWQDAKYGKCFAYSLEDAAGNHAFDDYPELFNLTEHEGHQIRAYFQTKGCRYDDAHKDEVNGWLDVQP